MNIEEQKSILSARAEGLDEARINEAKEKINAILAESFGPEYELDEMKISVKDGDEKGAEIPFAPSCRICYYPNGIPYFYCGGGSCP